MEKVHGCWWTGLLRGNHPPMNLLMENVLDFTGAADIWPKANLRALDGGSWIANNWEGEWEHAALSTARSQLCQLALQNDGPILELAAGAGGGNLSPLLHLCPDAQLIVNDLESRLLTRWSSFLSVHRLGRNVVFAAFDACAMPIADNQLSVISTVGGLGSLLGDGLSALRECARTLRPSGWLLVSEMVLTATSVMDLPTKLRSSWGNLSWLLGEGEATLMQAGFAVAHHQVEGSRPLNPEHDGLAEEAARFGLELVVEYHYLAAKRK